MRRQFHRLVAVTLFLPQPFFLSVNADFMQDSTTTPLEQAEPMAPDAREDGRLYSEKTLEPFTGKIVRNKVRMRLQPSLEAGILRELSRDDLLIVVGEADEFYAVKPPKDVKAYIFRTFILDNAIEGDRVNVRLEPALEAPIIAQLHRGDHVDGVISSLNSKWLEIPPPPNPLIFMSAKSTSRKWAPRR